MKLHAVTLPKAGTGLLKKMLDSLGITYNKGYAHMPHLTESELKQAQSSKRTRHLVLIRDIRDMFLSVLPWTLYHLETNLKDKESADGIRDSFGGSKDFQILNIILESNPATQFFSDCYKNGVELKKREKNLKKILFVRFEDLVGERGGGSNKVQMRTLKKINKFTKAKLKKAKLKKVADHLYGGTETFKASNNKGKIGKWRENFKLEHIQAIKKYWNDFLLTFGYETDPNWDTDFIKKYNPSSISDKVNSQAQALLRKIA